MSWIVGIFGDSLPLQEQHALLASAQNRLHTLHIPETLLAAAGGHRDTLVVHSDSAVSYIVAGIGLRLSASSTSILTENEWTERLSIETPTLNDLNGHFIILRWRNNAVEFYTDRAGLRTMYVAQTHFGWIFGTQLHRVASHQHASAIDWSRFGSRWLCLQQCSHESPVRSVHKIPPNGSGRIVNNSITVRSVPWLSYRENTESLHPIDASILNLITVQNRLLMLGLSGGLDSRVLLALMISSKSNFTAYSFGAPDDPDVELAQMICRTEGIPFTLIDEPFPSSDDCIAMLNEYVHTTNLVEGASSSVRLRYYSRLDGNGAVMIDGGNGEILRRQFLQRFAFRGRDDLIHRRTERLFPFFLLHRAAIFTNDIELQMRTGAIDDLDRSFHALPPPKEIGVENFLDAWTITMRIPVVACDEQSRIDGCVPNFMPFSQPDILQRALFLPLNQRRNNRMLKQIIRSNAPSLIRFPLVKNGILYPYRLTTLQSRIWTAVRSSFAARGNTQHLHRFLDTIKAFVLDNVHSRSVQQYDPYDYDKVLRMVTSYYSGNRSLGREVNWWIAFDVWRKGVEK